jgi:hypothetical protein
MSRNGHKRFDAGQVKAAAAGRELEILQHVAGIPAEFLRDTEGPCPWCHGHTRFRVVDRKAGAVYCSHCFAKENGDFLSAIQKGRNVDFGEALRLAGEYLGVHPSRNGHKANKATSEKKAPVTELQPDRPEKKRTPPEITNKAYRLLFESLTLSDQHRQSLRQRGFTDTEIELGMYRSLPEDTREIARTLFLQLGPDFKKVPGFIVDNRPLHIQGKPGLLIPVLSVDGQVVAVKNRPDVSDGDGKYRVLTSVSKRNPDGPSAGTPVHVPSGYDIPTNEVRITEGELKAEFAFRKTEILTIGIAGISSWKMAISVVTQLDAKTVRLAFDADARTNEAVASAQRSLYRALVKLEYDVIVETWPLEAGKGIDDLLASGGRPEVLSGPDAEEYVKSACRLAGAQDDARVAGEDPNEGCISNGMVELGDDDKRSVTPLAMRAIIDHVNNATDGWPRFSNGCLFVIENSEIRWLEKTEDFTASLHLVKPLRWHGGECFVTRAEFRSSFIAQSTRYAAIEKYPHEPPISDHFYISPPPQPGDGEFLRQFLDFFNPESDIDRELLKLSLLTMAWGGPGGKRPAFLITANGRGCGKTLAAEMLSSVFGGYMSFSLADTVSDIKQRLLSPGALEKRVAILDNVKTSKISSGDIEALVTANEISGKRMYVGESSRPNTLTWFITVNGASLSKDMAQRSIPICLARPNYSGDWDKDVLKFAGTHRQEIIADILGALREPRTKLGKYTRWAYWESEVLERLPFPDEIQAAYLSRQEMVDTDREEAAVVWEHFRDALDDLHYEVGSQKIFIPSKVAVRWATEATNRPFTATSCAQFLDQLINESAIRNLQRNKSNAYGRGYIWHGDDSIDDSIQRDIETRIENLRHRHSTEWRQ